MFHRTKDHASIIDLNAQTITSIDLQKKTYSVMTFEQMKQALDEMAQKMKQKDAQGEMHFKVSANSTGATKQIDGKDTKEMVVKMTMEGTDQKSGQSGAMNITMDMWIASGVAGYQEVRNFYKRMAEKIAWAPGGNMFMARPDVAKGMGEAYKEMAKIDGIPVYQVMVMAPAGQPVNTASAPPPDAQAQQQQQQQEKPSIGGALGGALGGKFGLGRKKQQQPESQPQAQQQGSANAGSLLEMTVQLTGFSSAPVSDADFAVPAGFKQVEPDLKRPGR
jgi:hypothetical protein